MRSCWSIPARRIAPAISRGNTEPESCVEPWRGYVAQKQYAIELCTKDWVLLLDADEEVSPGLAEEIRAAIASPDAASGYKLPRKNLFLGRWIRHGGFYPDPKLRLFRRGQGFVTGHDPHDRCELKPEVRRKQPSSSRTLSSTTPTPRSLSTSPT